MAKPDINAPVRYWRRRRPISWDPLSFQSTVPSLRSIRWCPACGSWARTGGTILFVNGGSAVTPGRNVTGTSVAFSGQAAYAQLLNEVLGEEGIQVSQLVIGGRIIAGDPERPRSPGRTSMGPAHQTRPLPASDQRRLMPKQTLQKVTLPAEAPAMSGRRPAAKSRAAAPLDFGDAEKLALRRWADGGLLESPQTDNSPAQRFRQDITGLRLLAPPA